MRFRIWVQLMLVLGLIAADSCAEDQAGDRIFGTEQILTVQIEMTPEQYATLQPAPPRMGPPGFGPNGFGSPPAPAPGTHRNTFGIDFPWSQGQVTLNETPCRDVGIRYKGNYTYLATTGSLKKSMKLDLNRNVKDQTLDGLTMINLHSGVSDPYLIREAFSFACFRDAGIPAPRTAFAEVTLTVAEKYDREFVGVYTFTEQVNKEFLIHHFQDGSGMLLKPEGLQGGPQFLGSDWKAYEDRYHPEKKPSKAEKQRLIAFARLISVGTDEEFARDIDDFVDVDAFLKFIAANALLSNLDSYLGYGHNYYMYLVPSTNKFVFIPWDLDLSLATWPAMGTPEQQVQLSIDHPHAGENKLIDRLFAIPEHRARYRAILRDLTATCFTTEKLLARVDVLEQLVKEPLAKEQAAKSAKPQAVVMGFGNGQFGQSLSPREFITRRIASVSSQLEGTAEVFVPQPFRPFGQPTASPPAGGKTPDE